MLTNHTFVLTTPSWNIQFLINNIKKNCRCQQVNDLSFRTFTHTFLLSQALL